MKKVKDTIKILEDLVAKDSLLPEKDQKFMKKTVDENNYYYLEKATNRKVWEVTNGVNNYYIDQGVYRKVTVDGLEIIYNQIWQTLSVSFASGQEWEGQKIVLFDDLVEENEFLKKYHEFITQYQEGYDNNILYLKLKQLMSDLKIYYLSYAELKEDFLKYQQELEIKLRFNGEEKENNQKGQSEESKTGENLLNDAKVRESLTDYQTFCRKLQKIGASAFVLSKANDLTALIEKCLKEKSLTANEKTTIDNYYQELKQNLLHQSEEEMVLGAIPEKKGIFKRILKWRISPRQKADYLNYKTMKQLHNGYFYFDEYNAKICDLKVALKRLKKRVKEYKKILRKKDIKQYDAFTKSIYLYLEDAKNNLRETKVGSLPYTKHPIHQILRNYSTYKGYEWVQRRISNSKKSLKSAREKFKTIGCEKWELMKENYHKVKRQKMRFKTLLLSGVFVFGASEAKKTNIDWQDLRTEQTIEDTKKAALSADLDREIEDLMNRDHNRERTIKVPITVVQNILNGSKPTVEAFGTMLKSMVEDANTDNKTNNKSEVSTEKETNPIVESEKTAQKEDDFITINKGDTLSKIAAREYGDETYYKEIAEYNHLEDPNQLRVGQVIYLPDEGFTRTRKL